MGPTEIVESLASGRMQEVHASFAPTLAEHVSPDEVWVVWAKAIEQFGAFLDQSDPVVLYDVPLTFERGDAHLQVAYRDGQVAGLVLRPGPPSVKFGD